MSTIARSTISRALKRPVSLLRSGWSSTGFTISGAPTWLSIALPRAVPRDSGLAPLRYSSNPCVPPLVETLREARLQDGLFDIWPPLAEGLRDKPPILIDPFLEIAPPPLFDCRLDTCSSKRLFPNYLLIT